MHNNIQKESRFIQIPLLLFFLFFLFIPLICLLGKSIITDKGLSLLLYKDVFKDNEMLRAILNSINISFLAAVITITLAFSLAYVFHFTYINTYIKKASHFIITLPMLLPTITYGFVLMYTFGNQGIITKILDKIFFSIYGFNGLLIGYVLYTLPIVYILFNNSMGYLDKRYIYVSHLMHDKPLRRFYHTVFHPMIGTIGTGFILSFILSFTDFGIPASVGGEYDVIALALYRTMLGSIVQFDKGAVIAIIMLIPSIFSLVLMNYLKKYEVPPIEKVETGIIRHRLRDICGMIYIIFISFSIIFIFSTIFIVPFTQNYPYDLSFTIDHLITVLVDKEFINVLLNSIKVAFMTAFIGTFISYTAALLEVRLQLKASKYFYFISMLTNTIPGMVLGISYLFIFNDSSLKGTLFIIILSNVVHFFTTPFMMARHALSKMDNSWEVTGALLQDTLFKTVFRVILPNSKTTLFYIANYYFINAMVTVSGVIFLVSSETNLLSTWIKQLQHYAKYNEIFILSLIILMINIVMKFFSQIIVYRNKKNEG